MNNKHKNTLKAIFEKPVRGDIKWSDIESMFVALGAKITEGSGSRVRVSLHGVLATFHRPHPRKETVKGAVKSVQQFLMESGAVE
jgi:hypothetical protein